MRVRLKGDGDGEGDSEGADEDEDYDWNVGVSVRGGVRVPQHVRSERGGSGGAQQYASTRVCMRASYAFTKLVDMHRSAKPIT